MHLKRRTLVSALAALPAAASAQTATPADLRSKLLGAWRLLDAVTIKGDGQVTPWEGRSGPYTGAILYAPSGLMSAQIASRRGTAAPGSDLAAAPVQDRLGFLDSYYAYFGRFDVDEATSEVRHHITASLDPGETGLTYRRKVALAGDRLTLTTVNDPNSHGASFNRLTWERA